MQDLAPLYPPSPVDVPADLTVPSRRYRTQVVIVLCSLLLFFLLYVALVAAAGYLTYWSVSYPMVQSVPGRMARAPERNEIFLKILAIFSSALLFLFLLKGFFKTNPRDQSSQVEIRELDQPLLFAFIRRLCSETQAPMPYRVFLNAQVNAAVFYNNSVLSLFWPTHKNLLIGLGLVNVLNLSEFKAVLAHEFGHFSQSSMKLGSYVYMANHV